MTDLRVALDARLAPGSAGGVESVVIGLLHGLSRLRDGEESYEVLVRADAAEWVDSYLGESMHRLVTRTATPAWRRIAKRASGPLAPRLRALWDKRPLPPGAVASGPPPSDGLIERAGVNLIHFLHQKGFRTTVPSIYHPHDLQHLHLPGYFSPRERAFRDRWYMDLAQQARLVVVASTWVREDVIQNLEVPADRVAVVPWAPVLDVYPEPTKADNDAARDRFRLPPRYVLYPAQTWPHKNHVALVDAIGLLRRRRRLAVPVVFSGRPTPYARTITMHAERAGVGDLVHWTGFVSPIQLQSLYRLGTAVVIPTRFEAASGPLWEAFAAGVPAACSNVTSLPAQAGNAAIMFDPDDIPGIADAVERLWMDGDLRASLVERGRRNVARYSWERTARLFRAHYRAIAGLPLPPVDVALLREPPLL